MFPSTKKKTFFFCGLKVGLLKCFNEKNGKLISTVTQYFVVILSRSVQFCQTGKVLHFPESRL